MSAAEEERLRRWRLVLGGEADGTGQSLAGRDVRVDAALAAVYDRPADGAGRSAGLGRSAPSVARWVSEVRELFPRGVVRVVQRDAVERLGLERLLLEPEMLEAVEPDVHLVATLLALRGAVPESAREAVRTLVRAVVEDVERRLATSLRTAVTGALDRSARTSRPRSASDVDWAATLRANLRTYRPETGTVVAERLVGHDRRRRTGAVKDVVLLVDSSGSMAASVVHCGVVAAVLASLRSLSTRLVVFHTAVVDLTDRLDDPVDVLLGVQLGGGTDIAQAVAYGAQHVTRPRDTVMFLVSDLFEGGVAQDLQRRVAALLAAGVTVVVLLALSDDGTPAYDHALAGELADLGAPAFAATPDLFPDLLAAALSGEDVAGWAQARGLPVGR